MERFAERIRGLPFDEMALAISGEFDRGADIPRARGRLDELAADIRCEPDADPLAQTRAFAAVLGVFRGNRNHYYAPSNSYLTHVLRSERGIPLTLAALWQGVGRRIHVPVEGIGFPGHFLVRVGGQVIVDVFAGGQPLSVSELRRLANQVDAETPLSSLLEANTPLQSARRMLLNIRRASMAAGDEARALLACDRLMELNPTPLLQRFRGLHAMNLGAFEAAAEDLRAYLEARPNSPHTAEVQEALARCQNARALH